MIPLILDVGCGGSYYQFRSFPEANVFMDIQKPQLKIRNFIVGDVCHSPFKDNVFDKVYCSHVLEHLDNPILAIKELIRTSKKYVIIKVPHRFSANAKKDKNHKSFFNITWFDTTLNHLNISHTIEVSWSRRLFLPIPNEITVSILKAKNHA